MRVLILRILAHALGAFLFASAIGSVSHLVRTGRTKPGARVPIIVSIFIGTPALWFAITGGDRREEDDSDEDSDRDEP